MDQRGWTPTLCVLVVATALFWRGRADDDTASIEAASSATATKVGMLADVPASDAAAVEANATPDLLAALADTSQAPPPLPPPTFTEPLPPWDAKLVDVLPALKARADAGDHVAACHIGLALSACAAWMHHQPSPVELRQIDPEDKESIDRAARLSVDIRRPGREKICAGLPESALDERFAYLQQSADAGNAAAMLTYAEGIPLQSFDAMYRHPEWLEAHRQRAPRYVAELIRRGDRFVAFLLSMNSDGMQMSILGKSLQMDEMTAATFWYLGRDIMSQPKEAWRGPTPAIERTARARAHALYTRYFEQRPFQSGEFKGRWDMTNVEHCVSNR